MSILGILAALPEIFKFLNTLWAYLDKVSGGDPVAYIVKSNEAFKKLNEAKSEKDYADAAKDLQSIISGH